MGRVSGIVIIRSAPWRGSVHLGGLEEVLGMELNPPAG